MALHADEVPIDLELVRGLLEAQQPELASLPLRLADPQGSDNVVARLGAELSVRLPRKESAVPSLLAELTWLPRLAPTLPLPVPLPVARGEPTRDYPFPWAVCRWLPGSSPEPGQLRPRRAAATLAAFVVALHGIDTTGAPQAEPRTNRGGSLAEFDAVTRRALDTTVALMAAGRIGPGLFDPNAARDVWDAALEAPAWDGPPVWLHRDLHCANLVASDGLLTGVLDFGGLVAGDPAGNVLGAWHVLDAPHRETFRRAVEADAATWARARGWALSQGLLALPYYLDTHPGMVRMAERAIVETTSPRGL